MNQTPTNDISWITGKVAEWLEHVKNATPADADHSSLLRRLLSGRQVLEYAPPRRFSYPDYELAEGVPVEVTEVNDLADGRVCIDQCPDWEKTEQKNIFVHNPTGHLYHLTVGESWIEDYGDTDYKRFHTGKVLQRICFAPTKTIER